MRALTHHIVSVLAGVLITAGMFAGMGCAVDTAVVVTVKPYEAMPPPDLLELTLGNASQMIEETFDIASEPFPITFSVTPGARQGELDITVAVLTGVPNSVIGTATTSVTIEADQRVEAELVLQPVAP